MKRFSLILVAMATFFLFSVVSFADTVIYDDDFSEWDGWDSGEPVSLVSSDGVIAGSYLYNDTFVDYFSSAPGDATYVPMDKPANVNHALFEVYNRSVVVEQDQYYKLSFTLFESEFVLSSADSITLRLDYNGLPQIDILAKQFILKPSYQSTGEIIFKAPQSGNIRLQVIADGSTRYLTHFSFNYSSCFLTPISPHVNTIEEWLEDIYNALVGESGEGGGTSNPELDDAVTEAGELQGSLDDFESSIQGDFDSSLNELDLGGFQLPTGILSSMSWIGTTWTSFFNEAGELQYIILFPCFVGLALLLIGRAGMAMHVISMKDKRNNKGDGT